MNFCLICGAPMGYFGVPFSRTLLSGPTFVNKLPRQCDRLNSDWQLGVASNMFQTKYNHQFSISSSFTFLSNAYVSFKCTAPAPAPLHPPQTVGGFLNFKKYSENYSP